MSKFCSLEAAISSFVQDGDCIAFGGFTTNRKPYAAVYEIIRQGKKGFYLLGGPAGGDADILIGAGRVTAYVNCYTGNSGFTNVSRRFRHALESNNLLFEDYSLDAQTMMYHAAAIGLPFIAIKQMLGSDLVEKWGICVEERKKHDKLPDKKLIVTHNPFNPEEQVCLLPTPDIDVAIIHVQKVSSNGVVRIEGSKLSDLDIALAARKCIVTCEEIVEPHELLVDSELNCLPAFSTTAIVHVPWGAHPSQTYNYYDLDGAFLQMYDKISADSESFAAFLQEWVYGVKNHAEYVEKLGTTRINALKIRKGLGYSI